ncbi:carbohydrate ABC transporter permease [Fodinicola feengrottensis]|uniref:Carbohydrate ABC transporter permease n=2 Tax=Fodinicola feengrottensis TaxID=435914 RepID=A0ABP4RP97_9ACTN
MNRTPLAGRIAQYVALAAYMVFLAFPLLWLLSVSLKSPAELASVSPHLIPRGFDFGNYVEAFTQQGLPGAAWNSTVVAIGSMLLTIVVALPAAYALGRFRSVLGPIATMWILVSQVFPVVLIAIPLFMIIRGIGLLNTLPGLILVYLVWTLPFALWMLRGYVSALPIELEEAAAVDGASRPRILLSVVLPLLRPGIIATAMFAFISAWNEFFFALVLLKSDTLTLPLVLARFVGAEGKVSLGPLAAASVFATLPSLAIFAIVQRRLTSGLLAGAVKG